MAYLKWQQINIDDFSEKNIDALYDKGFLFGRIGRGIADQTRSIRINLEKFEKTSENRRILKKTEGLVMRDVQLPFSDYDWKIGKLGKDFYDKKFGERTFSANKIKELLTDKSKSNYNILHIFNLLSDDKSQIQNAVGYCIAMETKEISHYCYPFYKLDTGTNDLGLGMMIRAIETAKEQNKKYIYLGSAQRPSDTYKLQFKGLEWFDGIAWQRDIDDLKKIIAN